MLQHLLASRHHRCSTLSVIQFLIGRPPSVWTLHPRIMDRSATIWSSSFPRTSRSQKVRPTSQMTRYSKFSTCYSLSIISLWIVNSSQSSLRYGVGWHMLQLEALVIISTTHQSAPISSDFMRLFSKIDSSNDMVPCDVELMKNAKSFFVIFCHHCSIQLICLSSWTMVGRGSLDDSTLLPCRRRCSSEMERGREQETISTNHSRRDRTMWLSSELILQEAWVPIQVVENGKIKLNIICIFKLFLEIYEITEYSIKIYRFQKNFYFRYSILD